MAVQPYPGVTVAQGLRGAYRGPERVSRTPYGMEPYPLATADGFAASTTAVAGRSCQ